jgi:hypothetical protein
MTEEAPPFFSLVSGRKHPENYLSRVFQACFTESPVFADSMLHLLWNTCHLKGKPPDARSWVCEYQPVTPFNNIIRPDLCLRPFIGNSQIQASKPIFIESKVDSRLDETQLKNYKESGTEILVAITKHWPEVSRSRLSQLDINHLRWQDVCHTIKNSGSRHTGKNRFLCNAFGKFLEYIDMAYREDITLAHLEMVRELFEKMSGVENAYIVPKASFVLADSCLSLLRDARRIAQETMPKLTECANWGPGYYHGSLPIEWHALGFEIYLQNQYSRSSILCGLYFPTSQPRSIYWLIAHRGSVVPGDRVVKTPLRQLISGQALDASRLARSILDAVGKWKPF